MRIALDTSQLARPKSGIGVYVEELARALPAIDAIEELLLLSPTPPPRDLLLHPKVRWPEGQRASDRATWLQFIVPRIVARERPDLTHFPNYFAPLGARFPYVVTFHDLVQLRHPELVSARKRWITRFLLPPIARRARGILTVSEAVRAEIVDLLGIAPERIRVVPSAPPPRFHVPCPIERVRETRQRLGLARPFVLAVGNLEPRKNLATLFEAFDRIHGRLGTDLELVVVGADSWAFGPTRRALDSLPSRESVRILRNLGEEDLHALFTAASVFAFPSLYEGFGLPPLEAMGCGTPVVASDIAAVREVSGAAALLVDPHSAEDWAAALHRLLTDPHQAEALRVRGRVHSTRYGWTRTSAEIVEAYRGCLTP